MTDSWHAEAQTALDPATAAEIGYQAAAYLASAVHDEVDEAHVGQVRILVSPDGSRIYAAAAVRGPLRMYLATAWGPAGHVSHKEIASYPTLPEAEAARDAALGHRMKQGFSSIGWVDGEP
ncbi:MAG TPA: hypothetical protein VFE42_18765 [Chloroflexota bacterium]|nr:hypothetical protein [Chloroflexota bacterium]